MLPVITEELVETCMLMIGTSVIASKVTSGLNVNTNSMNVVRVLVYTGQLVKIWSMVLCVSALPVALGKDVNFLRILLVFQVRVAQREVQDA